MNNDIKKIDEFTTGEVVLAVVIIKNCILKTSAKGNQFYDLTIADKTGEMNAKIWTINDHVKENLEDYKIFKIKAEVKEWQGQNQASIMKVQGIALDEVDDLEGLVPSAPIENELMYNEILEFIAKIEDEKINLLTYNIISKYKKELMYYPAAKKNHHSYRSGLLYHELRMLRTAEKIAEVYDGLNTDYLYSGVILHDICKIKEMASDELGIVDTYTFEGKLLGHIIMGVKEIAEEAKKIGMENETSVVLQHMILSHHYEPEYGSPVKPMVIEGEILHYLDIVDARIFDFNNVLKNVVKGDFSERVWVLDNRNVYKRNDER